MRVIGGLAKGFKLKTLDSAGTRPATDRVKESIFNLLPFEMPPRVLDAFAGSGALGIEALSRGAHFCTFLDESAGACHVVRENIAHVRKNLPDLPSGNTPVLNNDAKGFMARQPDYPFDLIFLDPPFPIIEDARHTLAWLKDAMTVLSPSGTIMFRQHKGVPLPDEWPLPLIKDRVYGINRVLIFSADENE